MKTKVSTARLEGMSAHLIRWHEDLRSHTPRSLMALPVISVFDLPADSDIATYPIYVQDKLPCPCGEECQEAAIGESVVLVVDLEFGWYRLTGVFPSPHLFRIFSVGHEW
jgi:hypothetical protein